VICNILTVVQNLLIGSVSIVYMPFCLTVCHSYAGIVLKRNRSPRAEEQDSKGQDGWAFAEDMFPSSPARRSGSAVSSPNGGRPGDLEHFKAYRHTKSLLIQILSNTCLLYTSIADIKFMTVKFS